MVVFSKRNIIFLDGAGAYPIQKGTAAAMPDSVAETLYFKACLAEGWVSVVSEAEGKAMTEEAGNSGEHNVGGGMWKNEISENATDYLNADYKIR